MQGDELLDHAIFDRVKADDSQASTGREAVDRRV